MRFPLRSTFVVSLLPFGALFLGACGAPEPEILADFDLRVRPQVLGGQDPFDGQPEIKLFLRPPDGRSEIVHVGAARGSEAKLGDLGPLAAGTVIGLLLEEPGGDPAKYNPSRLVGYGEAVLDRDLAAGGEAVELEILVPKFGVVGDMDTLGDAQIAQLAGVATIPGGDTFIFGGSRDVLGFSDGGPLDRVLVMRETDSGAWSFKKAGGTLPEPVVDPDAITVFDADNNPLILVTGGRPDWGYTGDNVDSARLYDPIGEAWVWGTKPNDAKLPVGRSSHRSFLLSDGSVFLYGGNVETDFPSATFAIFDPKRRDFTYSGELVGRDTGNAAASLGAAGVIVCGGANRIDNNNSDAVADCGAVSLQGVSFNVPPLPEPRAYLAMAPLPGGKVLAAGGISGELLSSSIDGYDDTPASAKAWVFDGSAWEEVPSMQFPRAMHEMIPLPDGRVLVVGGVEATGYFYGSFETPVLCTEVFDPGTMAFTQVTGNCTETGGGAYPRWSAVPGEGAFVLEGTTFDQFRIRGGESYGMVGFGPDLL